MKNLKLFVLAALAATAIAATAAANASATTLEVGGVTKNSSGSGSASLASGTKAVLARTDGSLANECAASSVAGKTVSPFTGTTVTGPISTLTFTSCTRTVTVHKAGTAHVEKTGTTNGTGSSSGAEVTVGSPFGTLTCVTGGGVDIGTLTGVAAGNATADVNAVFNCGFLVPSAVLKATYTITSPTGVGVSA